MKPTMQDNFMALGLKPSQLVAGRPLFVKGFLSMIARHNQQGGPTDIQRGEFLDLALDTVQGQRSDIMQGNNERRLKHGARFTRRITACKAQPA